MEISSHVPYLKVVAPNKWLLLRHGFAFFRRTFVDVQAAVLKII